MLLATEVVEYHDNTGLFEIEWLGRTGGGGGLHAVQEVAIPEVLHGFRLGEVLDVLMDIFL